MSHPVSQQITAIHAMLAAGHRNLRIERHSLVLWGLASALLFLISESVLTPEDLPDNEQRALAWLALLTFAMFFFGGGYMLCAAWLVILGLGLYVHGLFSEELLEWTGVLIILIGIASLGFRLSYETMRWIATAVFGLGLPLLAALLDRGRHRSAFFRLAQVLGWLLAVLALPLWGQQRAQAAALPEGPVLSLAEFRQSPASHAPRIVSLPAGTAVPVEIELGGDLFAAPGQPAAVLPLTLAEPVEVLMVDGKLSGNARFPGEPWRPAREARWISIPWLKAELTPERGPLVRGKLIVQIRKD